MRLRHGTLIALVLVASTAYGKPPRGGLGTLLHGLFSHERHAVVAPVVGPERHVPPGSVLVYRGTNAPDRPQLSRALRASHGPVPTEMTFLSFGEAREHAFHARAYHPDGVSVSTDKHAASAYGKHVIEYAVPKAIFDELPSGDPTLHELVFKHAVPDSYRTGAVTSH